MHNSIKLLPITLLFATLTQPSIAQLRTVDWGISFGTGLTTMSSFEVGMSSVGYGVETDGNALYYRYHSKPEIMLALGVAASGKFKDRETLGWDAGLGIRTGGFRIFVDLEKTGGDWPSLIQEPAPKFGETQSFRYWSLHLPLSITYKPFTTVGFAIGPDFFYQLSENPSSGNPSAITAHIGWLSNPKFSYPLNIGWHIGAFISVNRRIRIELQAFSDISNRLVLSDDFNHYREMGASLGLRYSFMP